MNTGHDSIVIAARVKNPVARRVTAAAVATNRTVSQLIADLLRASYGADEPKR